MHPPTDATSFCTTVAPAQADTVTYRKLEGLSKAIQPHHHPGHHSPHTTQPALFAAKANHITQTHAQPLLYQYIHTKHNLYNRSTTRKNNTTPPQTQGENVQEKDFLPPFRFVFAQRRRCGHVPSCNKL